MRHCRKITRILTRSTKNNWSKPRSVLDTPPSQQHVEADVAVDERDCQQ